MSKKILTQTIQTSQRLTLKENRSEHKMQNYSNIQTITEKNLISPGLNDDLDMTPKA